MIGVAVLMALTIGAVVWIGLRQFRNYDLLARANVERSEAERAHAVAEAELLKKESTSIAEKEERRGQIDVAILAFRGSIEAVSKTVGDSVAVMKSTARVLSESSGQTSQRTSGAVNASHEASVNVETAAGSGSSGRKVGPGPEPDHRGNDQQQLARAGYASRVLVAGASARQSGLLMDSVVMTDNLATIHATAAPPTKTATVAHRPTRDIL